MENINNPMIYSEDQPYGICFRQTKDTLLDPDIYYKFLYNAQNTFRTSDFYKGFKSTVMNAGLYRDQRHPSITSDMADLEMHHNFITLEFMSIILTEYQLKHYGSINTFELVKLLIDQHQNNRIAVIMLSETEHQKHHDNPSDFISIKQCYGNPFAFIEKYKDGMTRDICFKLLLHLKQEIQYGGSNDTNMINMREELINWSYLNEEPTLNLV